MLYVERWLLFRQPLNLLIKYAVKIAVLQLFNCQVMKRMLGIIDDNESELCGILKTKVNVNFTRPYSISMS